MVEVSKFLVDSCPSLLNLSCHELLHPWTDSCVKAHLTMLEHCLRGSPLFWLPIHGMGTVSFCYFYFATKCVNVFKK